MAGKRKRPQAQPESSSEDESFSSGEEESNLPGEESTSDDTESSSDEEVPNRSAGQRECQSTNITEQNSPDYSNDIVTILVGPTEATFAIHKAVVCKTSDFIRIACSGEWKESQDKIIRLPDIKEKVFSFYAHWLYTHRLQIKPPPGNGEADMFNSSPKLFILATLWILGNFLTDVAFTDAVVDTFLWHLHRYRFDTLNAKAFQKLLPSIPEDSEFHSILMDLVSSRTGPTSFESQKGDWPRDVLAHLAGIACRDGYKASKGPGFSHRLPYHAEV